jgi:hypothetical protein
MAWVAELWTILSREPRYLYPKILDLHLCESAQHRDLFEKFATEAVQIVPEATFQYLDAHEDEALTKLTMDVYTDEVTSYQRDQLAQLVPEFYAHNGGVIIVYHVHIAVSQNPVVN